MPDDICKKDVGEATKANPTHSTLDAKEHEADLENERLKRKESAKEIPEDANDDRKKAIDNGDKEPQDISNEYPVKEIDKTSQTKDKGVAPSKEVPQQTDQGKDGI